VDSIPAANYALALNRLLPDDITVLSSEQVDESFNARYSATNRIYRYYVYPSRFCAAVHARFCYPLARSIGVQKLNRLAAVIIGEHDFSSFATEIEDEKTTVRTINQSYFFAKGPYIVYHIAGNGFLRKMVRSIVGTILELERNGADAGELERILQVKSRSKAGETAPGKGLFLHRVEYNGRTA
jgi:tRNA pseudouridine38-40 synthase